MNRIQTYHRTLSGLALLAATAALAGCNQAALTGKASSPCATIVVGDASGSTAAMRSTYLRWGGAVVASVPPGGVFDAYAATRSTEACRAGGPPVAFPTYNPLATNELLFQRDVQAIQAAALGQVRAALRPCGRGEGSDLLHAFQGAADLLAGLGARRAGSRVVLMSDGWNQTRGCDFTALTMSEQEDRRIISALKARGELPDLSGATVWVAGCGADPSGRTPPERAASVRRFWELYLRACGAAVPPGNVAPTLQNFPGTGG